MVKTIKYFMLALLFCGQGVWAFENIAHRGFSGTFLENSLSAVTNAWDAGATIVEIDLRLTADGKVVLFHDDEIEGADVGPMSHSELERKSGHTVDTLPAVLIALAEHGVLLLDLKDGSSEFLAKLTETIKSGPVSLDRLFFQSRSMLVLAAIHKAFPEARCLLVSSLKRGGVGMKSPSAIELAQLLKKNKLYGISAKGRQFIDTNFVDEFRIQGLKYFVWTINDLDRIKHYKALGVDGIITDWPNRLAEIE